MDNLNKWLTLLANAGVLAGIIFLAVEINQNTLTLRMSSNESRTQGLYEILSMISESEALSAALAKVNWASERSCPDPELISNLTEQERILINTYLVANWFRFENNYEQFQEGLVDPEQFENRTLSAIRGYMRWFELFDVPQAIRGRERIKQESGYDISVEPCR